MLPFKENKKDNILFRTFSNNIDQNELCWHRDHEDREILVVTGDGWKFQRDNELPSEINSGDKILIKAGEWHRLIRGNSELKIAIKKL